jgi:hypothetical protein
VKKIKLNKNYHLVRCLSIDLGAMNGFTFDASNSWVEKKDNGKQFATRYTYTTLYAKKHKLYFECGTAKAAIQQTLITEYPNEKLKDMFFNIEFKNEPEPDFDCGELEKGDAIWFNGEYREIENLIHILGGEVLIDFCDGSKARFKDDEKVIIQ